MLFPFELIKDKETIEHSKNVAKIALFLSADTDVEPMAVYYAALWHDVGKSKILDIINKSCALTDDEFNMIKLHPLYSYEIIQREYDGPYKTKVLCAALYHHKRYDDTGYPSFMSGKNVDTLTKIIQIADVFDALISKRPYKESIDFNTAKLMILNGACGSFSDDILKIFKTKMANINSIDQLKDIDFSIS